MYITSRPQSGYDWLTTKNVNLIWRIFCRPFHIRFFKIIIEATDWLWAVLVLSWKHDVIRRSHIFQEHGGRFINLNTCNEKYNFYFVGEEASILPVSKLPSKEWLQKGCDFKNPLLFKILRIFLEICSKDNIRVEFGWFFKKILISKDYF